MAACVPRQVHDGDIDRLAQPELFASDMGSMQAGMASLAPPNTRTEGQASLMLALPPAWSS